MPKNNGKALMTNCSKFPVENMGKVATLLLTSGFQISFIALTTLWTLFVPSGVSAKTEKKF